MEYYVFVLPHYIADRLTDKLLRTIFSLLFYLSHKKGLFYGLVHLLRLIIHKHLVHENMVGGSSMIVFPLVIAVSERDLPGIETGPPGWHTYQNT